MDYAAIPPEINSGLIYAGPGSGPMLAAAAAWDELAAMLYATASSYGSLISDVASSWQGPASASMSAAATPYVSWLSGTAGQAELTGGQAKAAAAAYDAAFAMTVPPPVIAANRALLMALIATNFFGQNTPAIMATEALYMEMWAQDAAAMYGYQGASAAAATLPSFQSPLPTTNSAGAAEQAAAVAQAAGTSAGTSAQTVSPLTSAVSTPLTSAVSTPLSTAVAAPNTVSGVASTASVTSSSTSTSTSSLSGVSSSSSTAATALGSATGMASGTSSSMSGSSLALLGSASALMKSVSPAASILTNGLQAWGSAFGGGISSSAASSAGMSSAAMSASVGRAATLGMLSVPQGWTSAAPAFSQVSAASILPTTGANAVPAVAAANPGMFPPPLATLAGRESTPMVSTPRFDIRPTVVQRPVAAG